MTQDKAHAVIIGKLITALNKLALYPATHPVVNTSLQDCFLILKEYLDEKKEITFSISQDEKILVEGEAVISEAINLLNEFILQFKKLKAESITFSSGLSLEELKLFLNTLTLKAEDLDKAGGIVELLVQKDAKHIKVNLFSYIKIEKDKKIAQLGKDEIEQLDWSSKIKNLISVGLNEKTLPELKQAMQHRFLEPINKEEIAKLLNSLGDSLLKQIKTGDFKDKLNLAKSITKFYSELKKSVDRLEDKQQSRLLKNLINERFKQQSDAILQEALLTEYLEKNSFTPALRNVIRTLFSKVKEKDKKINELREFLVKFGLNQEKRDSFISDLNNELNSMSKTKGTSVDEKELQQLKAENARLAALVKNLEGQLKEKEALKKEQKRIASDKIRVESIIHNMADGLVVVDPNGKILLLNPAAEQLLNIKKQEALGKTLRENLKDEHMLTFAKDLKPDSDGGLKNEIELISTDEATKKVLRTSSAVIENQDGKAVGMVTILNDITRQRELEKLKSDFVANVSHELKTPLSVIQQSLSILKGELKESLNEDQKKFFSNSLNNLGRLRNLINDLLDLASIEAGKMKLRLGIFDINEIVKGVVEFLDKWAKTKNITLKANLLPSKTELILDKDRITQVLTNLVSNAIKFTPENQTVSINLKERNPDEGFKEPAVEISVVDTGIGIEAKDLERIFNKFEQVALAQPTATGGSGLGLTISKEIIQLHKGKIWVESEVGRGSKFSFLIPIIKEEEKE